ncbi:MAG: alkaline phosphatase family protein [Proteobacteria bacterium]|nr:alkaline phosphatase family protein [Pseudomonadota bacterium]
MTPRAAACVAVLVAGVLACASTGADPEVGARAPRGGVELPLLEGPPRSPGRVVLVSIAGLTPGAYLSPRKSMPTLATLAHAGVAADALVPVTPASTYPAHASLVTGRTPDGHGVVGDLLLGDHGVRNVLYWHASRMQAVPIWQVAREASLSVAALGWPSTLGASIDFLVPDVVPVRRGETWMGVLQGNTTPWLLEHLHQLAPEEAGASWPSARERDALLVDTACEIAAAPSPPQLWLLHLVQTGLALAQYGPAGEGARAAFGRADAELRRLVDCFGRAGLLDSTAILVVGDRPLEAVHTRLDPNVALWRAGLIMADPRTDTGIRSWLAIARSNGGSAFVYARSEAEAVDARDVLLEESRRTKAFRIVPARELQALHADPQAWFGLEAEPGFRFGDGIRPPAMRSTADRAAGGYLPSRSAPAAPAGFVAWGPGLRRGLRVPLLQQADVAPTVAALLGLHLPDVDGRALIGALTIEPPNVAADAPGRALLPLRRSGVGSGEGVR